MGERLNMLGLFRRVSHSRPERSEQARSICPIAFANTHKPIHGAHEAHPCASKVCESNWADRPCWLEQTGERELLSPGIQD